MKILFIITGLEAGGAENMLQRLLGKIDNVEFSCYVISLTTLGEIGHKLQLLGVPVYALGLKSFKSSIFGLFKLARHIYRIKPDLVHTWLYHSDLLGGLVAKIMRVPRIIWCVRCSDVLHPDVSWTTRVVIQLCAFLSSSVPNLVIYNSYAGADHHKKLKYREQNRVVIPNGIDTYQFKPGLLARLSVRDELGISPATPLVGLIGRYDPLKNHKGFIEAAINIKSELPEINFLLAGKGVDNSNKLLTDLLQNSGLKDCVHLLGLRNDIPRITAALDLAVLTSWSEAFPNVLIEAMACGIPCVSTNVGDAPLIIANDRWVVPVGDMVTFSEKVIEYFDIDLLYRHRYSEEIRKRIEDHFDLNVVVRKYEETYRSLEAGPQSKSAML